MTTTANTTSFASHYLAATVHLMDAVAHIGANRHHRWLGAKNYALLAQRDAGTPEEVALAAKLIDAIEETEKF